MARRRGLLYETKIRQLQRLNQKFPYGILLQTGIHQLLLARMDYPSSQSFMKPMWLITAVPATAPSNTYSHLGWGGEFRMVIWRFPWDGQNPHEKFHLCLAILLHCLSFTFSDISPLEKLWNSLQISFLAGNVVAKSKFWAANIKNSSTSWLKLRSGSSLSLLHSSLKKSNNHS